jgi:hypothetical protein
MEKGSMENGVSKCWLTAPGVLQGRHKLANVRGKRSRSECFMTNLFVVRIPYRGSVHYLTLYIVIKNQHITFLLKTYFLNIILPPLILMGDGAIWLSYSDSAMSKLSESP